MGKTTILPFIYDGSFDFYVRIAHSNIRGKWNHTTYVGKYFSKREHTLRDCIDWRLKKMRELEQNGLRTTNPTGKTKCRMITSAMLEQEEAEGKYKHLL